jgi:hypothetical protein
MRRRCAIAANAKPIIKMSAKSSHEHFPSLADLHEFASPRLFVSAPSHPMTAMSIAKMSKKKQVAYHNGRGMLLG